MKGYAISENLNYLFTPKGVVKVFNDKQDKRYKSVIPYTMDNIDIAFDILKENLSFKYQTNKIDLVEYSNYPRKVLHKVLSVIKPHNNISIISEWELKFGQKLLLINESVDKLIVEQRVNDSINHLKLVVEQWYNPATWVSSAANAIYSGGKAAVDWAKKQGQEISQKGLGGYLYDKGAQLWKSVVDGFDAAWNCVTKGIECIMEGIRSVVYSVGGSIVTGAISVIPVVGQISNAILFGALVIWDVYKMLSGKYESGQYAWSWMELIFDIIALIPGMGAILKGARTALLGLKSLPQLAKMATKGGMAAKIVSGIKSSISGVKSIVAQAAKFIGDTLGFKWLANWGTKTAEKLTKIADDLSAAKSTTDTITKTTQTATKPTFKQQVGQIWQKDLAQPKPRLGTVRRAVSSEVKTNAAFCAAMGLDIYTCEELAQAGQLNPTPEQLKQAEQGQFKPTPEQLKQVEQAKKLTAAVTGASEKIGGDF